MNKNKCDICGEGCLRNIKIYDHKYSLAGLGEAYICNKCYLDWVSGNYIYLDNKKLNKFKKDVFPSKDESSNSESTKENNNSTSPKID